MYKETITYTDFNDNERTEDFFFHLSKRALIELNLSHEGGLEKKIEKIVKENDAYGIMELFKELIIKSYGVKSEDGKKFNQSQEVVDDFVQSPAYDELFMKLTTDENAAQKFFNGIIPKDLAKQLEEAQANGTVKLPEITQA